VGVDVRSLASRQAQKSLISGACSVEIALPSPLSTALLLFEDSFVCSLAWATRPNRTADVKARERLVIRFNFHLSAAIGFAAVLMQTSCAHSPVVWNYYDQCAQENPSFVAMAECGRQKRLAECASNNACSPEGTTFMEYVDSLALSVKNKQMTEAEAVRRYAEYKSGGTSTCTPVGNTAKCN